MKGKAAKEMCLKTCEVLHISEWTLVAISAFYNSGKWRRAVDQDYVLEMWEDYEHGSVHPLTVDFALDILAGRMHPNWMMNKIDSMKLKPLKQGKPK